MPTFIIYTAGAKPEYPDLETLVEAAQGPSDSYMLVPAPEVLLDPEWDE